MAKMASRGISIYIDGSKVENSLKAIKSELKTTSNELAKMTVGSDEYIKHSQKIGQLKAILADHKTEQQKIINEYRQMTDASDSFGKKNINVFSKLKTIVAGYLASISVQRVVSAYADLTDAYADVQKYTTLTAKETVELNKDFEKLDTRTTRVRLNQLAGVAGRLGIEGKKNILDFVDAANTIDASLGDDLGQDAIHDIGKLAEMFGDADKVGLKKAMLSIGSAVNEISQNSASAAPYLVEFTNRMAGVGKQAGMVIPQIIGLGSVLDQNAQQVEMSATAISGLMMKLYQDPAKFARMAGLDVKNFTTLLKTDANEALLTLLDTLGKKGGMAELAPIFEEMKLNGARASSVLSVLAGNIDNIRKQQQVATQAFRDGTSVVNEYNVQNNTFSAQLDKSKNVMLRYATDIGEKLAPSVLQGASAVQTLMKFVSALVSVLIDHKATVIGVVSVYAAYTAAQIAMNVQTKISNTLTLINKLQTEALAIAKATEAGTTEEAAAAQTLYNTTIKEGGTVAKAYMAITKLWAVAQNLLTGNLKEAKVAFSAFMETANVTPLGMVTLALTAIAGAAYAIYTHFSSLMTVTKAIRDATKEFADELAKEQNNCDQLFNSLRGLNPQSDEYRKIKDKIISQYGQYLKNQVDEHGNLIDIASAQAQVNDQLREQIALKIKNSASEKITSDGLKKQMESLNAIMDQTDILMKNNGTYNVNESNFIRESINKNITKAIAEGKTTQDEIKKAIMKVIDPESLPKDGDFTYMYAFLMQHITEYSKIVSDTQHKLSEINKQYQGMFGESVQDPIKLYLPGNGKPKPKDEQKQPVSNNLTDNSTTGNPKEKEVKTNTLLDQTLEQLEVEHQERLKSIAESYADGSIQSQTDYDRLKLKEDSIYTEAKKESLLQLLKETTNPDLQNAIKNKISDLDKDMSRTQIADLEKIRQQKDQIAQQTMKDQLSLYDRQAAEEEKQLSIKRAKNLISEQEYQDELLKIREKYLKKQLAIENLTPRKQAELTNQLKGNQSDQALNKTGELEDITGNHDAEYKAELDNRTALLEQAHAENLLSDSDFYAAKLKSYEMYLAAKTQKYGEAAGGIANVAGTLNNTLQGFQDAEVQSVTNKYDQLIKAAEGNSDEQKRLEDQKQRDIAKIKAKYADKDFIVQCAQIAATTAQAAINAFSSTVKIPLVGHILAPIAAAAAVAFGMSQLKQAKAQRDAAKKGYFEGGFTGGTDPHQVRGYFADGSPYHGGEFVANHKAVSNRSLLPVFNMIDQAQHHNTVTSLSREDLAKALNLNSNGQIQVINTYTPVNDTNNLFNDELMELIQETRQSINRLHERLSTPIVSHVQISGDNGLDKAQQLYNKMKENKSNLKI